MKKKLHLLSFVLFLLPFMAGAQAVPGIHVCTRCAAGLNFDFGSLPADSSSFYIVSDTSQHPNLWQTGHPNKTFFTTGYNNNPNALVTDTTNPYPVSNQSSFYVKVISCSFLTASQFCGGYGGTLFQLVHELDTDTLQDGGTIEVSLNGAPWQNIINCPNVYSMTGFYGSNDTVAALGQPGFSGHSGWASATLYFSPSMSLQEDTFLLRFTFASDSVHHAHDGWNIGTISTIGIFESIPEYGSNPLFGVSPNPAADVLQFQLRRPGEAVDLDLLDASGKTVLQLPHFTGNTIPVSQLPSGQYLLRCRGQKEQAASRIVVQH